mmetsp:Transcript_48876/g.78769  ORF Transcript_48876/g.78769 Transcript_48876/m.78769 type:complete len:807 (-) Transcript_48876:4-2424(-)
MLVGGQSRSTPKVLGNPWLRTQSWQRYAVCAAIRQTVALLAASPQGEGGAQGGGSFGNVTNIQAASVSASAAASSAAAAAASSATASADYLAAAAAAASIAAASAQYLSECSIASAQYLTATEFHKGEEDGSRPEVRAEAYGHDCVTRNDESEMLDHDVESDGDEELADSPDTLGSSEQANAAEAWTEANAEYVAAVSAAAEELSETNELLAESWAAASDTSLRITDEVSRKEVSRNDDFLTPEPIPPVAVTAASTVATAPATRRGAVATNTSRTGHSLLSSPRDKGARATPEATSSEATSSEAMSLPTAQRAKTSAGGTSKTSTLAIANTTKPLKSNTLASNRTLILSDETILNDERAAEKKQFLKIKGSIEKATAENAGVKTAKNNLLDGDGKYLSSLYRYTDDGRDLSGPSRYKDDYWVTSLLTFLSSRVFQRILPHLSINMLVAASVSLLYYCVPSIPPLPGLIHAVTGSFLGLLIAFRTQTSYQRFWEARASWGEVQHECRSLARLVATHLPMIEQKRSTDRLSSPVSFSLEELSKEEGEDPGEDSVAQKKEKKARARESQSASIRILQMLKAFPFALQQHLRGEYNLHRLKIFLPDEELQLLSQSANMPLRLMASISLCFSFLVLDPEMEKHPSAQYVWGQCEEHVERLLSTIASSERLATTPVPLSYSRHTSRFLSIWTLTFPFFLAGHYGPIVACVAHFFVCWALLGTEMVGHMIEEPFGTRVNFPPPPQLYIPKIITETSVWKDFERVYLGKRAGEKGLYSSEVMAREHTENLPLLRYCNIIQQDIESLQATYGLGG